MKFLKWFGLTVLGILLFLSLSAFGIAFTANLTALNPGFVSEEIQDAPLSAWSNQLIQNSTQADLTPEVKQALDKTISEMEPQLKQELVAASSNIYDYLLGKKQNPELAATIRNTVLSDAFVDKFVDNFPLADFAANQIQQDLQNVNIPSEFQPALQFIQPAFAQSEAQLKTEVKNGAPGLLDYLVGLRTSFKISVDLQPVINNFISLTKAYYLKNPPPQLAGIPQSQLGTAVDEFINQNIGYITQVAPTNYVIDQNTINVGSSSDIQQSIGKAESSLQDARSWIQKFQRYYIFLIIFIIVLIAGIIALHHSVKGASRSLGSIFISYGLVEFIFVMLIKFLILPGSISSQLRNANIPSDITNFIVNLINHALDPLMWFSLGVLIAGIILLIISFAYRSGRVSSNS